MARRTLTRLLRPFERFFHQEASGGILLMLAAILALAWANSPWAAFYHHWLDLPLGVQWDTVAFVRPLHFWINDGLMAIFFFVVGLEIKREMLVGELSSPRQSFLPIAAAVGGMLIPAVIYAAFNPPGSPGRMGWGVPMATDIAFAIGVLALLGSRISLGLRVFLTALAIVDDLGAVLVIALFYTADVSVGALATAGGILLVLIGMNRLGIRNPLPYFLVGITLWLAVLQSGIHATIAGILLALTIPASSLMNPREFLDKGRETLDAFEAPGVVDLPILTHSDQQATVADLEVACEQVQSPLQRLERVLHPWVSYVILPLFALANAGVALHGGVDAFVGPIPLGILLGLVLGKQIGITLFSWLAVRVGLASLPLGAGWQAIYAVSWLGGIGFTMSLFVANLAFQEESSLALAKVGIFTASVLAGVVGWLLLRRLPMAVE